MLIISYDLSDEKLRTQFSKMLMKNGAIRLQLSVYELNHNQRIVDNIRLQIETKFGKKFGGGDSVLIFDVSNNSIIKYGNAIHRDREILYF